MDGKEMMGGFFSSFFLNADLNVGWPLVDWQIVS
jgi:hypothetical protein